MRKKSHEHQDIKKVVTVFNIMPVMEPLISPEPLLILVHNISDKKIAIRDFEQCLKMGLGTSHLPIVREGKYAAFGLPGGGVEAETEKNATKREAEGETGLSIIGEPALVLDDESKLILSDPRTGEMIRQFFYQTGRLPSIKSAKAGVREKAEIIENPVYIYLTRCEWENSFLRKLLIKKANEQIKNGIATREEIREQGIWINFEDELNQDEIDSLNIFEIKEIDGIGVFTFPFIQEILEETKNSPREERFIYLSHIMWIDKAIKSAFQKGII